MNAANYMDAEQPMAEYLATPAISAGAINRGRISMLHMHEAMTGERAEPTDAMLTGTKFHGALLEPDDFFERLYVFKGDKRTKEYKELKAEHGAEWIVTDKEHAALFRMSQNVHADPAAHRLISNTQHEISVFWEHPDYGAAKARPDGYSTMAGLFDIKSTKGIDKRSFARIAANIGYVQKMGFYRHGLEMVGEKPPLVHIICIEQVPPFAVVVYSISDQLLDAGRDEAIEIARQYNACRLMGSYPGITEPGQIIPLELPAWATGGEDWIPEEAQNESLA